MVKLKSNKLLERPIITAIMLLIVTTTTVIIVGLFTSAYNVEGIWVNIFVEAHGMLFDILVIVIVLQWFDKLREKQLDIKRWQEEIDDLRLWKSKAASVRIAGCIRRLNKLGKSDINLRFTYLAHEHLPGADLTGANLTGAHLYGTILANSILKDAIFETSDLRGAILFESNLEGASLIAASGLTVDMLANVKTLHMTKLDDAIRDKLLKSHPHLFEKPEPD